MTPANGARARVVVRVDASARIGMGHLRRCSVLGRRLRAEGVGVFLLSHFNGFDPDGEINEYAEAWSPLDPALQGTADARSTADFCRKVGADRAIIDHYHADEPYQEVLRDAGIRWLQFDGSARTRLWADWVVSMSPSADPDRYRALRARPQTRLLLGPQFAILRDEFPRLRAQRQTRPRAKRLLLAFGGGDDRGAVIACLEALRAINHGVFVDVVVGSSNPRRETIADWINTHRADATNFHVDTPRMADLMLHSDLAILSGGMTSFEAAGLGLPSMIISIADNQLGNARAWNTLGAAIDLGALDKLKPESLGVRIAALLDDEGRRSDLSAAGMKAVDCLGAERVVHAFQNPN